MNPEIAERLARAPVRYLAVPASALLPAAGLYLAGRFGPGSGEAALWAEAWGLGLALGAVVVFEQRRRLSIRRLAPAARELEERVRDADVALRAEIAGRAADAREAERHRERMRQQERRLVDAQRVARIGSWEWNVIDGSVTWSDETYRLFGLSPGEIEPSLDRYMEFVHPDDQGLVRRTIQHTLETGEPFRYDQHIVRADGVERIMFSTGALVRDAAGRPLLMSGTTQDVTHLRVTDDARRRTEARFRSFVEATNEWIWTSDLHGVATYSNPALRSLLGYDPGELVGHPWKEILHPDDAVEVMEGIRQLAAAKEGWSGWVHRWRHKDGSYRFLESNAVPMHGHGGEIVGYCGASRDVTARREAEDALRLSDERFHLAARATHDVLWDWDLASQAMWVNEGFGALLGAGHAARPRDQWGEWIHPDEASAVTGSLQAFLASDEETWQADYRLRRLDGSWLWILERGLVIRCQDGSPRRMLGSMMDITDRKESEGMKSEFVAMVSHQLRTPLSGMSWMLELAAEVDGMPADAARYIQAARDSGQRLVLLVNDLLDITRLESGRTGAMPQPVLLADLTRSVIDELRMPAADRRQDLGMMASAVPPVLADMQLIRQAITNLLSNAIKYTPAGGRITVALQEAGGMVRWSVQDDGIGIPRRAMGHLFEKFYRAENAAGLEAEGTGLGLHLVRLIIEDAGGRVWCESEEGRGSMFAFSLPAVYITGKVAS